MTWQNRSLDDIEQKIPQMQFVAECLEAGELSVLSHLDGLFPSQMSFPDKVMAFIQERVFYYGRMIELQDKSQGDAVERVRCLRDLFGFYAGQILGGNQIQATIDLEQQKIDVSSLFSLSHSFLLHAKALCGDDGAEAMGAAVLLDQADQLVSRQYNRYKELEKESKADGALTTQALAGFVPLKNEGELVLASRRLEMATMSCGNHDVVLAGANLDLFALFARESYFWQKSLAENSSIVFGAAIKPLDDLEHHAALLKTALERISIYASRGRQLLTLSSLIADCGLDLIEEARLDEHLKQAQGTQQGPLYSPR